MAAVFDPLQTSVATLDVLAAGVADAAQLADIQRVRLQRLLRAARRLSPWWRARLRDLPDDAPLSALPTTGRAELMAHFDDWVGDSALNLGQLHAYVADPRNIAQPYLGRYMVWESSGSGGPPGIFVQDAQALAVYDALEAQRRSAARPLQRWLDPLYLSERLAFVGATSGHFASHVSVQRLRQLNPWLATRLQSFSILQPQPQLLAQLNEFEPTIVATYPSAAALLADLADAGQLRFRPREVWTGGETLGQSVRQRIESRLGCAVRNSYGSSEFLSMAWECEQGRLHLNADWLLLEPVDAEGRPVPPGQPSASVLLTNLANSVQPLIRYALDDCVTVCADACACGSALPVIEVNGRQDDVLHLRGARNRRVALLPLALTTVLEDQAGVFDFQIAGVDERTLALALPADVGADARQRCHEVLVAFAAAQGVPALRVIERPYLRRGRSGKLKRVLAA